jgi:hypothetical protein
MPLQECLVWGGSAVFATVSIHTSMDYGVLTFARIPFGRYVDNHNGHQGKSSGEQRAASSLA